MSSMMVGPLRLFNPGGVGDVPVAFPGVVEAAVGHPMVTATSAAWASASVSGLGNFFEGLEGAR